MREMTASRTSWMENQVIRASSRNPCTACGRRFRFSVSCGADVIAGHDFRDDRVVTGPSPDELPADPRDALIREQAERLGEQERRLAAQAEQIAALEAMVADLRDRLAAAERAGSRNSGNSSMPPSADDLPGRKPPAKQRRAAERAEKKKRGKQPGSPGASMTWEVPDRIEDHYPEGSCPCGRDLADAADLGVARSFQQEEIPAAPAERVQHDLHEGQCACGRTHVAARPAGVPDSALSIGPRLRALAVYLVVFQHVPVERCRQLIADVTGAAVSDGFIHSCLATAASLAADVVAADPRPDHRRRGRRVRRDHAAVRAGRGEEIRPRRVHRAVLGVLARRPEPGGDGRRRDPAGLRRDRGLRPVPELLPPPVEAHRREPGVPVLTSCATIEDCAESYPGAIWPVQAQRALRGLIHAWHAAREQGLDAIPADVREAAGARVPARRPRRAWPACPASPGRRTARSSSPAASCSNSAATAAATCCVHHRHQHLAHEQHQRARRPAAENPAEDLRPPGQRRRHPGPPRHPQLHRHRPQARQERHGRPARPHARQALAATGTGILPVTTITTRATHHHT